MSYFNKWIRGTSQSYDPRRNRSKSLDVESLEISGIRLVMQNVRKVVEEVVSRGDGPII